MHLVQRIAPVLLSIALLSACGGGQKPDKGPPEVGVITLETEPVTLSAELTGRTSPFLVSEVRPQVAGIIKARLFTEGSVVRAGQPLYQIDPALYHASREEAAAQLLNAQAAAATAQAKADRYRTLIDTEAVSRQEAEDVLAASRQARASVQQAQAGLQTARINLGYTRIMAPIGGRIGRSSVTAGALVTASQATPLAIIQRLDPIYVDITQSTGNLLSLRRSLATGHVLPASAVIRLKLEDGSDYPQAGRIEFTEPIVNTNTGTVTIRARFPNPDGLLLPGMFVRVITPQGVLPEGILAPQQGISRDAKGNATALIVGRDGKVAQRTVKADRAIGDKWLITEGLKAGDRLIVEGTAKVKSGQAVNVAPVTLGRSG